MHEQARYQHFHSDFHCSRSAKAVEITMKVLFTHDKHTYQTQCNLQMQPLNKEAPSHITVGKLPHRLLGTAGRFCAAAAAAAAAEMASAAALRSQAEPRPLDMDMSPVISPSDADRLLAPDSPCAEPAAPSQHHESARTWTCHRSSRPATPTACSPLTAPVQNLQRQVSTMSQHGHGHVTGHLAQRRRPPARP